jgi:hypothetical protein
VTPLREYAIHGHTLGVRTASCGVCFDKDAGLAILSRSVNVEQFAVHDQMNSRLDKLRCEQTLGQILDTVGIVKADGAASRRLKQRGQASPAD